MERARATWTDERLDDLSRRVDAGFARVDADIRALSVRVDAQGEVLSARIDERFNALSGQFNALSSQFNALNRVLVQIAVGTAATVIVAVLGFLLTRG